MTAAVVTMSGIRHRSVRRDAVASGSSIGSLVTGAGAAGTASSTLR
jgi:hypothetical protein